QAVQVTRALSLILIMTSQVTIKGLTIPVTSRFLRLGLFWHFLDIIWVGIFSIVYLPGILRWALHPKTPIAARDPSSPTSVAACDPISAISVAACDPISPISVAAWDPTSRASVAVLSRTS